MAFICAHKVQTNFFFSQWIFNILACTITVFYLFFLYHHKTLLLERNVSHFCKNYFALLCQLLLFFSSKNQHSRKKIYYLNDFMVYNKRIEKKYSSEKISLPHIGIESSVKRNEFYLKIQHTITVFFFFCLFSQRMCFA